jgi:ubiquinone/menaquinone biosynthesis C-methylase UbiE
MSSVWDERAEAYRTSEAHREGEDLDLLVEWAWGARTALDVATGGGHVARRFRDAGLEVVSLDPAPGMEPDVVAPAEKLPFDGDSFDVVACRVAAHHFGDVRAAVREMARVSRERVLVSDNLFVDERSEEADRVRDASHVRNYTEAEWRSFFAEAGLQVEEARTYVHPVLLEPWLERAGCTGKDAERVRELVAERMDGDRVRLERICLKGRKRRES